MADLTRLLDGSGGGWLLLGGFWLLLFALAALEVLWPLHRAPIEGRGRLAANFGMGLLNAAIAAILPLSGAAAAELARLNGIGVLNWLNLPTSAVVLLTPLIWSLATYWVHRAAHHFPWFWRLHRVHHCDTAVDLSTGFRNHPGEALVVAGARAAVAIAFGLSAPALLACEFAVFLFAMWSHANLCLSARLDRRLRLLLITPTMHHIHHSASRSETDSNYGDMFSLWDRLFGTYCDCGSEQVSTMRFGLGDQHDATAARLGQQLLSPVSDG